MAELIEWTTDALSNRTLHSQRHQLGFLVSLARELAEKQSNSDLVGLLARWERTLEEARLAKEDVLSRRLTSAERQHFQAHRSATAAHWNLLTGLSADALQYAE